MSSTNTTTHYGLPVYQGTDLAEWTDTNTAFASIDDAVYTAEQNSAQAVGSVNSLSLEVDDLKVSVLGLKSSVLGLRADVNLNTSNITSTMQDVDQAQIDITKLKLDVADLIASKLGSYESEPEDWDTAPTANSTKPVTSGGVYTALQEGGASVEVNFTSTDTWAQIMASLYALVDTTKLNGGSHLDVITDSLESLRFSRSGGSGSYVFDEVSYVGSGAFGGVSAILSTTPHMYTTHIESSSVTSTEITSTAINTNGTLKLTY